MLLATFDTDDAAALVIELAGTMKTGKVVVTAPSFRDVKDVLEAVLVTHSWDPWRDIDWMTLRGPAGATILGLPLGDGRRVAELKPTHLIVADVFRTPKEIISRVVYALGNNRPALVWQAMTSLHKVNIRCNFLPSPANILQDER